MFISKKKYQEKMDLLDGYKDKVYRRNNKIADLEKEKDTLNNNIKFLEKSNIKLIEENQKLIEWIEKILNEVGIYEVSEKNNIRIPVCKNPFQSIYNTEFDEEKLHRLRKDIIIPEIRIITMG